MIIISFLDSFPLSLICFLVPSNFLLLSFFIIFNWFFPFIHFHLSFSLPCLLFYFLHSISFTFLTSLVSSLIFIPHFLFLFHLPSLFSTFQLCFLIINFHNFPLPFFFFHYILFFLCPIIFSYSFSLLFFVFSLLSIWLSLQLFFFCVVPELQKCQWRKTKWICSHIWTPRIGPYCIPNVGSEAYNCKQRKSENYFWFLFLEN